MGQDLESFLVLLPPVGADPLVFGEDIRHPVVPSEGVVVESHVRRREARLIHQEHQPVLAVDQFLNGKRIMDLFFE